MKKENLFEAIQRYISTKHIPFFVVKKEKEEVFFSKEDEKKLVFIVDKYLEGSASREEIYDSLELAEKFFMQKHHSPQDLSMPQLYLQALDEGTHGIYYSYLNQIGYAETKMEGIEKIMQRISVNKRDNQKYNSGALYPLIGAFETIGHEMTHYKQNSALQLFESSPAEYQKKIDEIGGKVISEYSVKYKMSEDEVKEIVSFAKQHLGEFSDFEWTEEMYQTLSFASYISLAYERDARSGGAEFSAELLTMISQSKYASQKVKAWSKASINHDRHVHQLKETIFFKQDYEHLEKFEDYFDVGVSKIISVVEKQEGKNAMTKSQISAIAYRRMLVMMVESKPLEEKKELLKFSISQGYSQFANALIDSIVMDANYFEQSAEIQEEVRKYLAMGTQILPENKHAYQITLERFLTKGQIISITDELIKNGKYQEAYNIVLYNKNVKYSIEKIYAYAETLEKKVPDTEKLGTTYFHDLRNLYLQMTLSMTLDEKIKMLQSKRAFEDPTFFGAILQSVRQGNHKEYKDNRYDYELFFSELEIKQMEARSGEGNIMFSDYEDEYKLASSQTNKDLVYGTHIVQKIKTTIGSAINKKKVDTSQVNQENENQKQ